MKTIDMLLTIISATAEFRSRYRLTGAKLAYRLYEMHYIRIGECVEDETAPVALREFALSQMHRLAIDAD